MRRTYPEIVQVCVPEGFRTELAAVANEEELSVSAYVRRLIALDIRRQREAQRQHRHNKRVTNRDNTGGLIAA